jgi:hypothetical protein
VPQFLEAKIKYFAMRSDQKEPVVKSWLKDVIIPTIVPVVVALIAGYFVVKGSEPKEKPSSSIPASVNAPEKENVTFYLSNKSSAREERQAYIDIGEPVLIHWSIDNSHGEKFYLTETELNGYVRLSKEVPLSGIEKYDDPFDTVDCTLERDEGSQRARSILGSLRIKAIR